MTDLHESTAEQLYNANIALCHDLEARNRKIAKLKKALREIRKASNTIDAPFERGATIENIINEALI